MRRMALATLLTGIWVNASEFLRNQVLFDGLWQEKYAELGLVFPAEMINGALWGVWGFVFAGCIVWVRRQATWGSTVALCWTMGFALMWIVIGNLNVLPIALLPIALPWSLVEVAVAAWIAQAILKRTEGEAPAG